MPVNKYALLRYRIIDKCIRNKYKPFPNKEDLREACEDALYGLGSGRISESTIEKDLYAMRFEENLGYMAPISYSKTHKGYFYEEESYSIDNISLSGDELEAIKLATLTLGQFKNIEAFRDFDFAIGKLLDRVNLSDEFEDDSIQKYIQFETVSEQKGTEYLSVLLEAIKNSKEISLEYRKFSSKEPSVYKLQPYLLKEYRNRWYLIASNEEKGRISTFGLDRIISVCIQPEEFSRSATFDLEKFFKHSFGITSFEGSPSEIILEFSSSASGYVLTQPLHATQKVISQSDAGVKISIEVLISPELIMHILSYGSQVRVISPISLIELIKKELKTSQRNY